MAVRYEMSKVRTMTFKKIYDLHKQVQIAETLELGYRRMSVASATEVERERRHHAVKIRRQLSTLDAQLKNSSSSTNMDHEMLCSNLQALRDMELVMSDDKL